MACFNGGARMAGVLAPRCAPSVSSSTTYLSIKVQRFRAREECAVAIRPALRRRVVCQNSNDPRAEATELAEGNLEDLEAKASELNGVEETAKEDNSIVSEMKGAKFDLDDNTNVLAEMVRPDVEDDTTEFELNELEPDVVDKNRILMEKTESIEVENLEDLDVNETELNIADDDSFNPEIIMSNKADSTATVDKSELTEIQTLLKKLKVAATTSNEEALFELDSRLQAIEEERYVILEQEMILLQELSSIRDDTSRLSREFEEYRRLWENEQLALAESERSQVIENLLPMLKAFEMVKNDIDRQTEIEQKIANSYGGIERQFLDIMKSLGAVEEPVEVGSSYVGMHKFLTQFWDRIWSWFPSPSK